MAHWFHNTTHYSFKGSGNTEIPFLQNNNIIEPFVDVCALRNLMFSMIERVFATLNVYSDQIHDFVQWQTVYGPRMLFWGAIFIATVKAILASFYLMFFVVSSVSKNTWGLMHALFAAGESFNNMQETDKTNSSDDGRESEVDNDNEIDDVQQDIVTPDNLSDISTEDEGNNTIQQLTTQIHDLNSEVRVLSNDLNELIRDFDYRMHTIDKLLDHFSNRIDKHEQWITHQNQTVLQKKQKGKTPVPFDAGVFRDLNSL